MPKMMNSIPIAWALIAFIYCNQAHAQLLDDKANLKILQARSQLLLVNKDYFEEKIKQGGAPASPKDAQQYLGRLNCGSVEIGNQGVNTGIAKEISVVIVGDVINFGNHCGN
jgi:hypothetical protein